MPSQAQAFYLRKRRGVSHTSSALILSVTTVVCSSLTYYVKNKNRRLLFFCIVRVLLALYVTDEETRRRIDHATRQSIGRLRKRYVRLRGIKVRETGIGVFTCSIASFLRDRRRARKARVPAGTTTTARRSRVRGARHRYQPRPPGDPRTPGAA